LPLHGENNDNKRLFAVRLSVVLLIVLLNVLLNALSVILSIALQRQCSASSASPNIAKK
jgi:hypothetical protein